MHSFDKVFLGVLDQVGTFAFAVSGAVLAVQRRMDIFGVLVLALITAVGGGIVRDLIIGAVPPAAFHDWHMLAIAVFAGILCFFAGPLLERLSYPVLLFDAAGLGIFAVTGTQKALQFGIDPIMAGTLGVVTGIGGGILRDLLAQREPSVLRTDIYASAAIASAVIVLVAHQFGVQITVISLPAVAVCFVLRVLAIYRGWALPIAPWSPPTDSQV
jgi:uncharacterized membrane protein YeiH